jgi:hypothetical protein
VNIKKIILLKLPFKQKLCITYYLNNSRITVNESMEFTMRLCHIKNYKEEYGFNIASKSYPYCYHIGTVDLNTPAYYSGLKSGKYKKE